MDVTHNRSVISDKRTTPLKGKASDFIVNMVLKNERILLREQQLNLLNYALSGSYYSCRDLDTCEWRKNVMDKLAQQEKQIRKQNTEILSLKSCIRRLVLVCTEMISPGSEKEVGDLLTDVLSTVTTGSTHGYGTFRRTRATVADYLYIKCAYQFIFHDNPSISLPSNYYPHYISI
ncbi:unnamed protein product [Cylicocyclus nassatus]|uniref:Uncharacterized protein n=1 Tax=Cylicocyclus nassatus TaxID=53992 RepID=A0AA36M6W7_CYLNA|nr:unnamed protein product [Cylicocyclus nassatus]